MPPHNGEEYVLLVGATRNVLADINVALAMFWALGVSPSICETRTMMQALTTESN